jgi:sulfotransferase family protein
MATAGPSTNAPFFVVGAQRSGTTMLRLMLNNHPRLAVPFESGFIPVFFRRLTEYGDLSDPPNAARLLQDICLHPKVEKGKLVPDAAAVLSRRSATYCELVDAIFSEYARRKGKVRWGDKTPAYITEIDILLQVFPHCRLIHIVRDGRDVALSLGGINWGSRHIPRVAEDWRWKTVLAHKIGTVLGDRFIEVRFEDLVHDAERELRRICAFLGEAFDPAVLQYSGSAESEMPSDSMQWHQTSTRPPDPEKVYEWKRRLPVADRILFEAVAGDALDLFGYEREHLAPTVGSRIKSLYYALVQRW